LQKFLLPLVAVMGLMAGILVFKAQSTDFTTLDGQGHKWSELKGNWVVVNYFAEWCAPCLREIPELNRFAETTEGTDIKIFAVSYDELDDRQLLELKHKYQIDLPIIKGFESETMPAPRPGQLPTTYIISPQGETIKTLMGEQSSETLHKRIAQLKLL